MVEAFVFEVFLNEEVCLPDPTISPSALPRCPRSGRSTKTGVRGRLKTANLMLEDPALMTAMLDMVPLTGNARR